MTGPLDTTGMLDRPLLLERDGRWRLAGAACPRCGRTFYPPRELCPDDLEPTAEVALPERGTLYEAAHVLRPPQGFERPYWVALVDLQPGVRVFAPLEWTEPEPPAAGTPVDLVVGPGGRHRAHLVPAFRAARTRPAGSASTSR